MVLTGYLGGEMKWFQKKAKLEYCVIYMNSGIRLETAVDEMIQKGWRPQGGISCMMTEKLIGEDLGRSHTRNKYGFKQ